MSKNVPITVAHGDGIGPEIMDATLRILKDAGARLDIETIEIGEQVYKRGVNTGIEDASWDALRRTGILLKAPITTPRGGGVKSLNVTIRKMMSQYANVRPCVAYSPFIDTKFPGMDVVVIRENEEDLYAGIEHQQTADAFQSLKLMTRQGAERICRYAFEYARANGRKKVTCFVKDNIMKVTDGMFRAEFERIGEEYPEIEKDNIIIDIGCARMADTPEMFDVVVGPNLYMDIVSDIAAQITGSVGLCPSANIGEFCSMFEAIHGSAPDIAGKGIANPSGLLHGAIMMLVHIGQGDVAETVNNAWLKTIEQGIHTGDIYRDGVSRERVDTKGFCEAVLKNMGGTPETLKPVDFTSGGPKKVQLIQPAPIRAVKKELVGFDAYIDHANIKADGLAEKVKAALIDGMTLKVIASRGTAVWPEGTPETYTGDHWSCRFIAAGGGTITKEAMVKQLDALNQAGLDFIKIETLFDIDDNRAYSYAQGE